MSACFSWASDRLNTDKHEYWKRKTLNFFRMMTKKNLTISGLQNVNGHQPQRNSAYTAILREFPLLHCFPLPLGKPSLQWN